MVPLCSYVTTNQGERLGTTPKVHPFKRSYEEGEPPEKVSMQPHDLDSPEPLQTQLLPRDGPAARTVTGA